MSENSGTSFCAASSALRTFSATNSISSGSIADATIQIVGKGTVTDTTRKG